MSLRAAVLLVILAAIASTERKQLSGPELEWFLGPAGSNLIKWNKRIVPDGEFYEGSPTPPLSGTVNISILLSTWSGPAPPTGGPDRLGVLAGTWGKARVGDLYLAGFDFGDARRRKIHVNINASSEADADTIALEVSRLPMFNATLETPFHDIMVRKQIARVIDGILFPAIFVAAVWIAVRFVRKRKIGGMLQALVAAAISGAWLLGFRSLRSLNIERFLAPTVAAIWKSNGYLSVLTPLLALVCLSGALSLFSCY